MSEIFFTSDLHFGHKNIIDFAQRPFADVQQMNSSLINNWNKVVTNLDRVYLLGDLSFCFFTPYFRITRLT